MLGGHERNCIMRHGLCYGGTVLAKSAQINWPSDSLFFSFLFSLCLTSYTCSYVSARQGFNYLSLLIFCSHRDHQIDRQDRPSSLSRVCRDIPRYLVGLS